MTGFSTVIDMQTGRSRVYSLSPREALVAAWEQDDGNNSTWDYEKSKCPVTEGRWHLFAGDLAVRRKTVKSADEDARGKLNVLAIDLHELKNALTKTARDARTAGLGKIAEWCEARAKTAMEWRLKLRAGLDRRKE